MSKERKQMIQETLSYYCQLEEISLEEFFYSFSTQSKLIIVCNH